MNLRFVFTLIAGLFASGHLFAELKADGLNSRPILHTPADYSLSSS
jgi:hypothetical protein